MAYGRQPNGLQRYFHRRAAQRTDEMNRLHRDIRTACDDIGAHPFSDLDAGLRSIYPFLNDISSSRGFYRRYRYVSGSPRSALARCLQYLYARQLPFFNSTAPTELKACVMGLLHIAGTFEANHHRNRKQYNAYKRQQIRSRMKYRVDPGKEDLTTDFVQTWKAIQSHPAAKTLSKQDREMLRRIFVRANHISGNRIARGVADADSAPRLFGEHRMVSRALRP